MVFTNVVRGTVVASEQVAGGEASRYKNDRGSFIWSPAGAATTLAGACRQLWNNPNLSLSRAMQDPCFWSPSQTLTDREE